MEHNNQVEEAVPEQAEELIDRIGQLTRALNESMRELGLDREVEKAADAIPDARDRLNYIATMTEQAAETALSSIEVAQPLQTEIENRAVKLDERWQSWFDAPIELVDARELVRDTRSYLQWVPEQTQATSGQLHDIMMAQDFQDLTGQVIKKLVVVIRDIEKQLIEVLLRYLPEDRVRGYEGERREKSLENSSLLNGPQIQTDGNTDIVTDQAQVDDLLDSLGF
ncbi:Protein phosphatase CheZ [Salinisphaera shabanensis E1L3A]|uniref:Protein phosphatase CheZ n=1 Tax=Salinisphaera shabanensis E1L3A TaxID=1033802 RepID=U2EIB3_9GAMM|nr:protein phosphatase CheZ [Salinisphaera shabanensis]ERJ17820.1 Protein phosphatase CheZ [Salinisphaera shabanensis E1L3A]